MLHNHISDTLSLEEIAIKKDYRNHVNLSSNELHSETMDLLSSQFLESINPLWFSEYPYYPFYREQIALFFQRKPEEIILYPGSDHAIKDILFLLTSKSKRMILQYPNYYNYENYGKTFGVEIIKVPALWEIELPDSPMYRALIDLPPSLLVLTNPCGISGRCMKPKIIEDLVVVAQSYGHFVIIDETYLGFSEVEHLSLLEKYSNLLIVRSFSKFPGMAGARLAVVFAAKGIVRYMEQLNPMNGISRTTLEFYRFVSTNEQLLKAVLVEVADKKKRIIEAATAADPTISCIKNSTNFLLMNFGTIQKAEAFLKKASDNNYIVKSLSAYPEYKTCLRISVPKEQDINKFISLFSTVMQSSTPNTFENKNNYE